MSDKPKPVMGRPTLYKPEFCEMVIPWLKEGYSIEEIGLELDVGYTTVYEWMERHPDFAAAIKRGREFSKAWWMKNGRSQLNSDSFNSTLWYMNMKNRFGWADKKEIQNNITVSHEDSLKALPSE